jgi:YVTN family beta-propeller protein
MRFRNLGLLEAWEDGRELPLGRGRQRALLALLVLHANEAVSSDRLIDDLWGERSPPSAPKVLQGYVSKLRRVLPPDAIVTRGSAYLLRVADTDAAEFERLLESARGQEPREAAQTLRKALALWRGRPFADVEYEGWAQAEIGRLEELRLDALEERIEADLALGFHHDVVAELESLVAAHPLRERLRGLLMLALYRCDRQAEALEAYRAARATLVEALGIEPSKALQRLEQAILTQAAELDGAGEGTPALPAAARARGPVGTVTFLSLDVEGSTRLVQELRDGYADVLDEFRRIVRDAVGTAAGHEVDTQGDAFLIAFQSARNAVGAAIAIRDQLRRAALPHDTRLRVRMGIHAGEPGVGPEGYHGLAVVRVSRICAAAHGDQILLSSTAQELVEGELPAGARLHELGLYLLKGIERPERLYQLDAGEQGDVFPPLRDAAPAVRPTGLRRLVRRESRRRDLALLGTGLVLLAAGVGAGVYRLTTHSAATVVLAVPNSVAAIDPATNRVVRDVPVGNTPTHVAFGSGSVWVLNSNEQTVSRIDPGSRTVLRTVPAATAATDIAVGAGALWAGGRAGVLARIDPDAPLTAQTLPLRGADNPFLANVATSVAATAGEVWAAIGGAVWRIEPAPRRRFALVEAGCCGPIAIGPGAIWVGGAFGVERLDASSGGQLAGIRLPFAPGSLAAGAGGVWVGDESSDRVWRIDPKLNAVGTTVRVGAGPSGIAVGLGSVWIASADGTVSRIDPSSSGVVATIKVGGTPSGIAVGAGQVWVAVD